LVALGWLKRLVGMMLNQQCSRSSSKSDSSRSLELPQQQQRQKQQMRQEVVRVIPG
jgi:hypothetical protein